MPRWRNSPEPWWPTVYTEQQYIFPDAPSRHDPALERFAVVLADTLLRSLPARYSRSYSLDAAQNGEGVAKHTLDNELPRVFPRLVVMTPQSKLEPRGLQHYRYHPDAFDDNAGWANPDCVMHAIRPVVTRLRRKVAGYCVQPVGDEYLGKIDTYHDWHPSSYRLSWAAAHIANELITAEGGALGIPDDNRPHVALQGLMVVREGHSVVASQCEAKL